MNPNPHEIDLSFLAKTITEKISRSGPQKPESEADFLLGLGKTILRGRKCQCRECKEQLKKIKSDIRENICDLAVAWAKKALEDPALVFTALMESWLDVECAQALGIEKEFVNTVPLLASLIFLLANSDGLTKKEIQAGLDQLGRVITETNELEDALEQCIKEGILCKKSGKYQLKEEK